MRGAAVYAVQQIENISSYDGIIASNMLSIADLKALVGKDIPPVTLYFHENQISYPLAKGIKEDLHFGFTDFTSALSAETILFNSKFHMRDFTENLKLFLRRFPDFRPDGQLEQIQQKSRVIYPGVYLDRNPEIFQKMPKEPLIIWNHRWEHDKNPQDFFSVLYRLNEENIPFQLAVLGESYRVIPSAFHEARKKLKSRIIHFGYAESVQEYKAILNQGNIIISTANQENFGISVIEAIGSGNFPLLPRRLSYSEIIPAQFQKYCLYKNKTDLIKKIKALISHYNSSLLSQIVEKNKSFGWPQMIKEYDTILDSVQKKSRTSGISLTKNT